jgi:hypothetical protein
MPFYKNYKILPEREGFILEYFIGFIFGFLVSWVVVKIRFKNGNFQINESDVNKDVYTLYIDDFNKAHTRRYLLLRITRK